MLPSPWCNHRRWGSGWVETASGTFISQGLISVFSICICLLWNVENNILYPQFRLVLKQWRAQWGCDHSLFTSYLWGNVQSWEKLYHSKWLNLPISLIYILNMSHPFTNCGRGVDFYLRDNPLPTWESPSTTHTAFFFFRKPWICPCPFHKKIPALE